MRTLINACYTSAKQHSLATILRRCILHIDSSNSRRRKQREKVFSLVVFFSLSSFRCPEFGVIIIVCQLTMMLSASIDTVLVNERAQFRAFCSRCCCCRRNPNENINAVFLDLFTGGAHSFAEYVSLMLLGHSVHSICFLFPPCFTSIFV